MNRKLYRSTTNRMVAGVLGGMADTFRLDATILRLLYVVLLIFSAGLPFILLYIAAVFIIPKEGESV